MENVSRDPLRKRALVSALVPLFAATAPTVGATTFVTNCNDAGPGSLRAAVAAAFPNDTVDATGLTTASPGCARSRITVKTGAIAIDENDMTIEGPGTNFTVTAKYDNGVDPVHQYQTRLFTHARTGTLKISNLTLAQGYLSGLDALGGCLYSHGNVILDHVNVGFCTAKVGASGMSPHAYGGGVYAYGALTLLYSTLSFNGALGGASGVAAGGGARVHGNLTARYSSINTNYASGASGGIDVLGPIVTLQNTTIAANHAKGNIGGIRTAGASYNVTLLNSTISGNRADGTTGGLYGRGDNFHLYNTTIAFNTAGAISAGVALRGRSGAADAVLRSTLIANNTYGAAATSYDLAAPNVFITGGKNLVRTVVGSVPADTIVGKCPLLVPLRQNGGLTLTHALLGNSPAIDAGDNPAQVAFDQRGGAAINGVRDYPRASGPPGGAALVDIGAFEVDRSDKIFDAGFDGCP